MELETINLKSMCNVNFRWFLNILQFDKFLSFWDEMRSSFIDIKSYEGMFELW